MTEGFFPGIWNILHDGVIVAVDGTLPGDLRIDVEIGYFRKRIPDPGTLIQVRQIGGEGGRRKPGAAQPARRCRAKKEVSREGVVDGAVIRALIATGRWQRTAVRKGEVDTPNAGLWIVRQGRSGAGTP